MDIARNFYKKAASSSGLRRFSWNRKKPRTLKFRIKFMLAVFVECTSISNQEFLPKDETNVWLKPDWVELTSVRYWSSLILASWTSCRCKLRVSKNHNSYQISKKKKDYGIGRHNAEELSIHWLYTLLAKNLRPPTCCKEKWNKSQNIKEEV